MDELHHISVALGLGSERLHVGIFERLEFRNEHVKVAQI